MALVKMTSLRAHTYEGVERPEGTVYEADEQYVETLEATGMARRVTAAEKPIPKKK